MAANLISVSYCVALTGLAPHEIILGVAPSDRHERLYETYFATPREKAAATCERIASDIRAAIDLGAAAYAADLLIVLRRALALRVFVAGVPACAPPPGGFGRSARLVKNGVRRRAEGGATSFSSSASAGSEERGVDNVFSLAARRAWKPRRAAAPQT